MPLTDEQIITGLRALRPTPSEQFSAELDAWAAAGFPRLGVAGADEERGHGRARGLAERLAALRPNRLVFAAGVAIAFLALVVAVTSLETGEDLAVVNESTDPGEVRLDGGGGATGNGAAPRPAGEESAVPAEGEMSVAAPEPTTVPPSPSLPDRREQLKPGRDRVQELSASMTLSTGPAEVDDVADGVVEATERHQGIIVSSNVSTGERGRATFDLRVPTAALQAALADFSDLASVRSRDEGTLDITVPFVAAGERFNDARAEVGALLGELREADSATEIASIREQLIAARAELAAARAEVGAMKRRANFSRVSLTVLGDGDGNGWSLGDAADDAGSVLEGLAGAALVALAVIVPLGVLAIASSLGWNRFQRRRRESALDE